jgi:DNA polymerase delta subunit 4
MKRWRRANGLGLHPPIEVLAVLLKEEAKDNTKMEMAMVDKLMS